MPTAPGWTITRRAWARGHRAVLANAGGVTVSYFEWVQDFSSFFWTEDKINNRLDRLMASAFHSICEVATRFKVTLRTAACIVACKRILQARQLRGLCP